MTENHPITPPPELIAKWAGSLYGFYDAVQWGANQELEACCEWVTRWKSPSSAELLRRDRRPKPPSLAELALTKTNAILNDPNRALLTEVRKTLEINRRALERLKELEQND